MEQSIYTPRVFWGTLGVYAQYARLCVKTQAQNAKSIKKKRLARYGAQGVLAEREGFEPSVTSLPRSISSRVP